MRETRISQSFVPILDKIEAAFGKGCCAGFYTAYDHTIYTNGMGTSVSPDIQYHEEVHFKQQDEYEGGVDAWWDEYLANPEFRFDAELEAYGKQIAKFSDKHGAKRTSMLNWAARSMTMSAYGGMVTFIEARKRLKEYVDGQA